MSNIISILSLILYIFIKKIENQAHLEILKYCQDAIKRQKQLKMERNKSVKKSLLKYILD
jgi:hypothetical protein